MTDKKLLSNELSLKRLLIDSVFYSGSMNALILGSLYYDAEMWVGDYPPDIQEKFGPKSDRATRLGYLVAIPFFLIAVGGVVLSNLRLKRANGGRLSPAAAFLNAYALFFSIWFVDLTMLDWLLFVTFTPGFVVLPGTEGMDGYDDYGFHFREHMKALPLLSVPALIIAFLTASRSGR